MVTQQKISLADKTRQRIHYDHHYNILNTAIYSLCGHHYADYQHRHLFLPMHQGLPYSYFYIIDVDFESLIWFLLRILIRVLEHFSNDKKIGRNSAKKTHSLTKSAFTSRFLWGGQIANTFDCVLKGWQTTETTSPTAVLPFVLAVPLHIIAVWVWKNTKGHRQ